LLGETVGVFERGDNWLLMPLYPYGPGDLRLDLSKNPPNAPSAAEGVALGTDMSGRDIVPLMLYGFRISLAFALLVATCGYMVGVVVGGLQGYYGGWVDIASQRFVEIWGSIPFLFTMMILASLVTPTFGMLVVLLVLLRSWIGITFYVRGEFYREKSKDYVQAAVGAGVSDWKIIIKHILPNSIVPVVTFAPFAIVGFIGALVSLDYLGFGLPVGTPSWGALLRQGLENVKFYPHLVIVPTVALAVTLYSVVMIGEAVREAFDPKVFSRLR
jgi:microcin C transport system permease protein